MKILDVEKNPRESNSSEERAGVVSLRFAAEVYGSWSPYGTTAWRTTPGKRFFLATWCYRRWEYGWFGIYHPSLGDLEEKLPRLIDKISRNTRAARVSNSFSTLSQHTPGWGVVCATNDKVRVWRDPIGRLPIFWAEPGIGTVEWGTLPGLLKSFDSTVRVSRLKKFLLRAKDFERDDFWQRINRIRAGEVMTSVPESSPRFSTWWQPWTVTKRREQLTIEQRAADLLSETIKNRVPECEPVLSLSGGVDSSLLAAILVEEGESFNAFSMVDSDTRVFDERRVICDVARVLGYEVSFVDIGGGQEWRNETIYHEPHQFGPVPYPEPAYYVPFLNECFDSGGDVMISGLGADQVFGVSLSSYYYDKTDSLGAIRMVFTSGNRKIPLKILLSWLGSPELLVPGTNRDYPFWYRGHGRRESILKPISYYDLEEWKRQRQRLFQSFYWEQTMRLLEGYRRRTGVLMRTPFLDPRVVSFGLSLRPIQLRCGRHQKYLLRSLLSKYVPARIAFRPKSGVFDEVVWKGMKQFLLPEIELMFVGSWLHSSGLIEESFFRSRLRGVANRNVVTHLKDGHRVWRTIAAEIWMQTQG